jgi:hypothetical protein
VPRLSAVSGVFVAAVLLGLQSGVAWAQDAAATPAPTLNEAVSYLNQRLAGSPSPWRPCQSASQVAIDDEGYVEITTTRSSYCADSRQRIHVLDLDEALVTTEIDVEGVVVLGCKAGADCVRHFRRRKVRGGAGWEAKDDRWVPDGPETMPHLAAEARIEILSDPRVADQISSAFRYLARSAAAAPDNFTPPDPFAGRVAQLSVPAAP